MKETLLDWLGTFWKVLIFPTPKTFLKEAKKAHGKFGSAMLWLIFYAIYIYIMLNVVTHTIPEIPALITILILIPLTVVLFASAMNFICQRIFREKQDNYDALLYITVAILLPVFFILTPISTLITLDAFRILSFILLSYQVVLLTIGVKTIVDLEYWQALVAVFLSIVAGIIISGIIFILIVSAMTPPPVLSIPTMTPPAPTPSR